VNTTQGNYEPIHTPEHRPVATGVKQSTVIALCALMLIIGFVLGTRGNGLLAQYGKYIGIRVSNDTLDLNSVQQTYRELTANFDGEIDEQALIDGASRGLVAAAGDRYTVFMDRKESEEFNRELSGQVSGIGAEIGVRGDQPTILRVLSDSPAEKAGVAAGDVIIGVNDISMKDADSETAAKNIRGDEGTSVKLSVTRAGVQKDFTITRAKVTDTSVRTRVDNGVGIITISRFDTDTGDIARQAAEDFKSQGVKAVILDVRDNGGGYLDAGKEVAGLWVQDKPIVSEKSGGKVTDTISSSADPILNGMKTVVLVNGSSASASEIVAGALQDYKLATLVGEKTFGKGTVQKMINLADGRQLKVTIARWYTPNGRNITKEGIAPDVKVEMTVEDINAGKDPQLDAALKSLQ
jgi:carboxyl-terminal processing protease